MSNIRFCTQHDDHLGVVVQGSERAHGLEVAIDASLRVLGADTDTGVNRLLQQGVLPRDATAFTAFGKSPVDALAGWMRDLLGFNAVTIGGETVPVAHAVLNTAAVEGPDAVAFLARLHGSVEDRIWVDADDVEWFATLLDFGRAAGILRADVGWEAVIDRVATATGPVVISSSQGREFPDMPYDEETGDPLPVDDPGAVWHDSLERLRQSGWWLQLTPDNLRKPAYAPLRTFQDLLGAHR
jgi:hypothetical protein